MLTLIEAIVEEPKLLLGMIN